jgi:hypothetical protein
MIAWLFKWAFRLVIILLVIRIFFPDSEIYQDYIGPITEPIFESLLDELNTLATDNQESTPKTETQPGNEKETDEIIQKMNDKEYLKPQNNHATPKNEVLEDCMKNIPPSNYRRTWQSLQNNRRYASDFSVSNQLVCESNLHRINLNVNEYDEIAYWQKVYGSFVRKDSPKMTKIFQYFKAIQQKNKLDYAEFAEMVVAFIQSIPYTLVLNTSAQEAMKQGGFARTYIAKKQGPYIENVKFALQTPIEFMYNLKGDCDTRTVLAYAILSHFGYDVAVINNSVHSMLGINLPAQGSFLPVDGKKYFLWETTATGWQLGNISPEMLQDKKWFVALPSVND